MANQIRTTGSLNKGGFVGETSGGTKYAVFADGASFYVYKNIDGTPSLVATATPTAWSGDSAAGLYCLDAAMDSADDIHVVAQYVETGSTTRVVAYAKFDTGTDSFGTVETVVSAYVNAVPLAIQQCAIDIDSTDVPHVAFEDVYRVKGTNYKSAWYVNRSGGSWGTPERMTQDSETHWYSPHLIVGPSNTVYYVYLLAAAQYSESGTSGSWSSPTIHGKNASTNYNWPHRQLHNGTSWYRYIIDNTLVDENAVGTNSAIDPPISAASFGAYWDGTNRFIVFADRTDSDIKVANDSAWGSLTTLETGTYTEAIVGWQYHVLNNTLGIDVLIGNGDTNPVYWTQHSFGAAPVTGSLTLAKTLNQTQAALASHQLTETMARSMGISQAALANQLLNLSLGKTLDQAQSGGLTVENSLTVAKQLAAVLSGIVSKESSLTLGRTADLTQAALAIQFLTLSLGRDLDQAQSGLVDRVASLALGRDNALTQSGLLGAAGSLSIGKILDAVLSGVVAAAAYEMSLSLAKTLAQTQSGLALLAGSLAVGKTLDQAEASLADQLVGLSLGRDSALSLDSLADFGLSLSLARSAGVTLDSLADFGLSLSLGKILDQVEGGGLAVENSLALAKVLDLPPAVTLIGIGASMVLARSAGLTQASQRLLAGSLGLSRDAGLLQASVWDGDTSLALSRVQGLSESGLLVADHALDLDRLAGLAQSGLLGAGVNLDLALALAVALSGVSYSGELYEMTIQLARVLDLVAAGSVPPSSRRFVVGPRGRVVTVGPRGRLVEYKP